MADLAYKCGVYDILRAKELNELDRLVQISKGAKNNLFALGIYSNEVCEQLDISEPLKSLEDRMSIMEQIIGVDFVFPVYSLDEKVMRKALKEAYTEYCDKQNDQSETKEKEFEIGYAPGTYDLFHAGHLENLTIAAKACKKLIVGVKSNELVMEHKHKKPIISDDERMEILRHFKFVFDVYKYHTRDLNMADLWIKSKYGEGIGSVFLGSDLKEDFKDCKKPKITYTQRDPELMKTRSTSAYRTLRVTRQKKKEGYIGKGNKEKMEKIVSDRANRQEDEIDIIEGIELED